MKDRFIAALQQNNLAEMRKVPKAVLHNHSTRGGNKRYIEKWCGTKIPDCPKFREVRVTVNSDGMLIFDQSVSQEFFNLYHAGLFSAEELNEIRENALAN